MRLCGEALPTLFCSGVGTTGPRAEDPDGGQTRWPVRGEAGTHRSQAQCTMGAVIFSLGFT